MRVGGGRVAAQMRGWWKSKRFCEVPQAARRGGGRGDRVRRASRRSGPTATWTRRGSTTGGPHRGGYLGVAGGVAWMQEGHSPDESWVGVREVLSQYGKSIANVGASQGTSGHGQFGVARPPIWFARPSRQSRPSRQRSRRRQNRTGKAEKERRRPLRKAEKERLADEGCPTQIAHGRDECSNCWSAFARTGDGALGGRPPHAGRHHSQG